MNNYEFGKFLAKLRNEKGLTQTQLAEKLNITDETISQWETGKNYPDMKMCKELSKIFDISISELFEGKRIERENLSIVNEEHTTEQIKKSKKSKKKCIIAIFAVIALAIVITFFALMKSGFFSGVIYNDIPFYSDDVITIMNTIDGYISQRPKAEGKFSVDSGHFFMKPDKTLDNLLYFEGSCENGRSFYINGAYREYDPTDSGCSINEYRRNLEKTEGIPFDDLERIVSQIDISLLPIYEKYDFEIDRFHNYDNHNLNSNDLQKSIIKFIYSDGVLKKYNDSFLSGEYLMIQIFGVNGGIGDIIAYVFYEK